MSDIAFTKSTIASFKKKTLENVNCFDGEETYYVTELEKAFEEHLLTDAERDFNLHIYYGLDSDWKQILNTCQQAPMFGDKMVVLIKEASKLKDINELAPYLDKLPSTTYLCISHKYKKLDGRGALAKALKKVGTYHTFKSLYDNQVPAWIMQYAKAHDLEISETNAHLLSVNMGTQLEKIANELEKVRINLKEGEKEITGEHIEKYIGISKDYNFFEFSDALIGQDKSKVYKIIRYVEANAKTMPMTVTVATLYGTLQTMHTYHLMAKPSVDIMLKELKLSPFQAKKAIRYAQAYTEPQLRNAIKLLYEINQKERGIGGQVAPAPIYIRSWLGSFLRCKQKSILCINYKIPSAFSQSTEICFFNSSKESNFFSARILSMNSTLSCWP